MSDERMRVLLAQKSVGCTLRKQPPDITKWFYDALIVYGHLWVRPDRELSPVKVYIEELFSLLKFVALPNNVTRKQSLIATKWPVLKEKIDLL